MPHINANLQFARRLADAVTVQPFLAALRAQRRDRPVVREVELREAAVEQRQAA